MSVLTFKNVHVVGKKVLKGVELTNFSLEVNAGETVALVGEKAPLVMAALTGKAKMLSGEIYVSDYLLGKAKLADRDVEYVPCDEDHYMGLAPKKPVRLAFITPLKKRKMPEGQIKSLMESAAQRLDISHLLDRKPRALASKQKVRVVLGSVATRSPRAVVMEDVFKISLPEYREDIGGALKASLEALGLTVLFYTTAETAALAAEAGARIVEVN